MIVNDLPSWLPTFNMVVAIAALALAIPGLRLGWNAAYRAALFVALVILLSGAMFQANILPLWAWVIFGSGGRLLILAIVAAGTFVAGREHVRLEDVALQLVDIQRTTAAADRERGTRIETALAENTDLTKLAATHADAAYKEANSVNEKIASQGAALVEQGEQAAADRLVGADTNETAHRIDERVP